jgi:predicted NAD/FAD-binding protein
MMPSWFCQSYLFWASHRDEAYSSDVIHSHTTKPILKTMQEKKKKSYVSKGWGQ